MLGIDPDRLIPPAQQRDRPLDFDLWPEHATAWDVYQGCGTLWRKTIGLAGVLWDGLDYPGLEVVMRRYRVPQELADEVFAQVQVMERETVRIRNGRK